MATCHRYDEEFFAESLMGLNLNQRHQIVQMLYKQTKKGMLEPNFVWIAWEWFGKSNVEALDWHRRYALYKVIQWLSDRRERILHHKLMSDLDLKVNVYKWEISADGYRRPRYDDYDDCEYYTGTELFLLCREKVAEESEKKSRQRQQ